RHMGIRFVRILGGVHVLDRRARRPRGCTRPVDPTLRRGRNSELIPGPGLDLDQLRAARLPPNARKERPPGATTRPTRRVVDRDQQIRRVDSRRESSRCRRIRIGAPLVSHQISFNRTTAVAFKPGVEDVILWPTTSKASTTTDWVITSPNWNVTIS